MLVTPTNIILHIKSFSEKSMKFIYPVSTVINSLYNVRKCVTLFYKDI